MAATVCRECGRESHPLFEICAACRVGRRPPRLPLPEPPANPDEEPDDTEPWQIAWLLASRHPYIVYWLLVGITFAVELFVSVGVAESESHFAAVLALPLAFLPLVFFWLAIDRTKRFMELRRLLVGRWRADGVWQIQFTRDGKLLLNDSLTADYALYANLDLGISSEQVQAVLGERIVSLGENELVLTVGGSVCRFNREG